MRTVHMNALRRYLLRQAGLPVSIWENKEHKLPATFSTNGQLVGWVDPHTGEGHDVLVLTSLQARNYAADRGRAMACRPHRILIRCRCCGSMQFAGRLVQHEKACGLKVASAYDKYARG